MIKEDIRQVDWFITLVPLITIIGLCIVFFIFPGQSNFILTKIRDFLGDVFGAFYLLIGLGVFFTSIYIASSKYGEIILGEPGVKPQHSFVSWGAMM